MNKYHYCVNTKDGDWTIDGRAVRIPLSKIMKVAESKKPQVVAFEDICWKGMYTHYTDPLDKGYHHCDISFPGILVEDGPNPANLKYRMIDGIHRMRKMLNRTDRVMSEFYVLSNAEFMNIVEKHALPLDETDTNTEWDKDEHIELIDTKNYFGFPVCVYRFKKHDELKDQMVQEVNTDGDSLLFNGGYIRSKPSKKPILLNEKDNALAELNTAYQKTYEHFYNDVLDADLSMARVHAGEDDNSNFMAKPIVTQSWVVGVPANPSPHVKDPPMGMHTHFLSPVCGSYYLSLDENANGGNLIFANPMMDYKGTNDSMYLLTACLRAAGSIKFDITHPIEEGQIVIWAGVLPHTIEPIYNSKKQRISIITNSCVNPLPDVMRQYNYNISPFYQG